MKKLTSILSAILIITSAVSSNVYAVETENSDLYALADSLGADTDYLNIPNYVHNDSERPLNWAYFDEFYKNCSNLDGAYAEEGYKLTGETGSALGISIIEVLAHNGVISPSDILDGAKTLKEISFCDEADKYITLYSMLQEHFELKTYYRYLFYNYNREENADIIIDKAEKNMSEGKYFLTMIRGLNNGVEAGIASSVAIGITDGEWEYEGKAYDKCILTLDSNFQDKETGGAKGFSERGCIYINSKTKDVYVPIYNNVYDEVQVIGIDDDSLLNYHGAINPSETLNEDMSLYYAVTGYQGYGMFYDFETDLDYSEHEFSRETAKVAYMKGNSIKAESMVIYPEFVNKHVLLPSQFSISNIKGSFKMLTSKAAVYESNDNKLSISSDDDFIYVFDCHFNEGYYNFAPVFNWDFNGTANDDISVEVTDEGFILRSSSDTIRNNVYTFSYKTGESGYIVDWQTDLKTLVFTSINDVMVSMDKNGKLQLSIDPDKDGVYDVFIQKGDANGDGIIDATDASAVLTTYAMNSTENGEWNYITEDFGDFNNDGVLDATDASAILSYYANSSVEH
mgnify:CR=1 FL=1